jgi:hypothetical protein
MNDVKKKINEKEIFENRLNDIINESRNNIDNKMKLIINLLSSIKDENEQIMSKSKYIS